MLAYKLTGEIQEDHKLIADVPDGIEPGYADVLLLVPQSDDEIPLVDDPEDLRAFRKGKAEIEREGTVSLEQVKADLGL
ncbi:MAG TPA: hypothetical protein ENN80_00120 [Candidatus Hydrogenedentes bacterium]|nr:hypothetical protein [Candidatus Hydrogenedentota bacterium]